jgi:hypothetical protein
LLLRRFREFTSFWGQGLGTAVLALVLLGGGHDVAFAQDGVWRYSVRPGDNIWDLSRRYLADWRNWTVIQELNGIDEPRGIPPGSRLDIPLRLLRLDPASATLVDLSGSLVLLRDGAEVPVAPGIELRIGDRLVAGPEASGVVRFADNSTVTLGSDSELVFDRLGQYRGTGMVDTRLRLERGRLETEVQPAAGSGSHFEVWTPPSVSSVRGTDLRVGLDAEGERSVTEVLTGQVEVAAVATVRRVDGGFGTVTRQGDPPAPPRPLLEPPPLEALPASLERLPLRLPMPELAGAEDFRFALATDPSFQPLLVEEIVPAGGAARLDLPDGRYAARLRGIEADGLEGRDQVWELEVFARPEPPTPLSPQRDGRLRDPLPQFGWSEPLDAAGYRFALATDPDFASPLVETDTLTSNSFMPATPLPLGTYYWRVGTIDADGRRGPWGDVLSFEVLAPPAEPAIDEMERDGGRFTIRLSALEPGQRVRFQIASDADFDEILYDQTADEPELVVPGLLPDDYWFRAQIIEADGYVADFSTPQRITVPPASWWPALLVPFALLILLL